MSFETPNKTTRHNAQAVVQAIIEQLLTDKTKWPVHFVSPKPAGDEQHDTEAQHVRVHMAGDGRQNMVTQNAQVMVDVFRKGKPGSGLDTANLLLDHLETHAKGSVEYGTHRAWISNFKHIGGPYEFTHDDYPTLSKYRFTIQLGIATN